jgi:hypothetical protein
VSNDQITAANEIEELMKRYCLYFDSKEPQLLGTLFTVDAQIDYGPEVDLIRSRAELIRMVAAGAKSRFESTNHQICNELVTFTNTTSAEGTSHLYAWHKYYNNEVIGHLWGGYRYRFEKIDDKWFISALKLYASGMEGFHREKMHDFREIVRDVEMKSAR